MKNEAEDKFPYFRFMQNSFEQAPETKNQKMEE